MIPWLRPSVRSSGQSVHDVESDPVASDSPPVSRSSGFWGPILSFFGGRNASSSFAERSADRVVDALPLSRPHLPGPPSAVFHRRVQSDAAGPRQTWGGTGVATPRAAWHPASEDQRKTDPALPRLVEERRLSSVPSTASCLTGCDCATPLAGARAARRQQHPCQDRFPRQHDADSIRIPGSGALSAGVEGDDEAEISPEQSPPTRQHGPNVGPVASPAAIVLPHTLHGRPPRRLPPILYDTGAKPIGRPSRRRPSGLPSGQVTLTSGSGSLADPYLDQPENAGYLVDSFLDGPQATPTGLPESVSFTAPMDNSPGAQAEEPSTATPSAALPPAILHLHTVPLPDSKPTRVRIRDRAPRAPGSESRQGVVAPPLAFPDRFDPAPSQPPAASGRALGVVHVPLLPSAEDTTITSATPSTQQHNVWHRRLAGSAKQFDIPTPTDTPFTPAEDGEGPISLFPPSVVPAQ